MGRRKEGRRGRKGGKEKKGGRNGEGGEREGGEEREAHQYINEEFVLENPTSYLGLPGFALL